LITEWKAQPQKKKKNDDGGVSSYEAQDKNEKKKEICDEPTPQLHACTEIR
jgi:hypothetical protein